MSNVVIRAEGLGKKYLIGHQRQRERYVALRDVLGRTARSFARAAGDMLRGRQLVVGDEVEEYWALKDVNFEISRGEVVGIIGRNGAGKSTLLKVLSRITEPSAGRVEISGRIASLLEVGTGFHPELTGRENVYLNGAILGMRRAEIRRKFDEIVDFADVEKFLDTPVKRYSSGMYVRLAFAVAAHLEPEILVVDEVLAVGDAEFQKKCLGKMKDVATGGRTVLFVSHNLAAVGTLCQKAALLADGRLIEFSPIRDAMSTYLKSGGAASRYKRTARPEEDVTIMIAEVRIEYARDMDRLEMVWALELSATRAASIALGIRMKDLWGTPIGYISLGALDQTKVVGVPAGASRLEFAVSAESFAAGRYTMSIDTAYPNIAYLERLEDCLTIDFTGSVANKQLKALEQSWGWGSIAVLPTRVEVAEMGAN